MKVMRYECSMAYGAPVMDEDPEYGEWVKFEDYERLRAALERAATVLLAWGHYKDAEDAREALKP